MKIYIDADGCPVVNQTLKIADRHSVKCVIICDTSHRIELENTETIVVDKGADSADFRLVNLIKKGDIAITQDYGLAAMCLSKNAAVIIKDGIPDNYRYCIKDEGCHLIYHRFTPEDYENL